MNNSNNDSRELPLVEKTETGEQDTGLPGIVEQLGELGSGALITESGLAELLHRHPVSIKRAVERGELPPPTRLLGRPVWTAGAIVRHLEARLEQAAETQKRQTEAQKQTAAVQKKETEQLARKVSQLSP